MFAFFRDLFGFCMEISRDSIRLIFSIACVMFFVSFCLFTGYLCIVMFKLSPWITSGIGLYLLIFAMNRLHVTHNPCSTDSRIKHLNEIVKDYHGSEAEMMQFCSSYWGKPHKEAI